MPDLKCPEASFTCFVLSSLHHSPTLYKGWALRSLAEELLAASRQVEAGRQQEQALQRMERLYQQVRQLICAVLSGTGNSLELWELSGNQTFCLQAQWQVASLMSWQPD